MTFKEAKQQANLINGVVDWWWTYSVYTAEQWRKFNGSHGYGVYVSLGAQTYFHKEYLKANKQKDILIKEMTRKIKLGISPWSV